MGLGASLIFISSFVCEAAYSIVGKKIISRAGPLKVLALSLAGHGGKSGDDGPTTLTAVRMPAQVWLLIMGLALICTAFGYGFWFLSSAKVK
jgi:drug/metabolite transporter (DMT)-like permease